MGNDTSLLTRGLETIEELMVVDEGKEAVTVQRVQLTSIMPKGKRLHSSDDVDAYIDELKMKLLKAIEQDKEILV
jgi:hypothetical protein